MNDVSRDRHSLGCITDEEASSVGASDSRMRLTKSCRARRRWWYLNVSAWSALNGLLAQSSVGFWFRHFPVDAR